MPSPRAEIRSRRSLTPQHLAVLRGGIDWYGAFIYSQPSGIASRVREGWEDSQSVEQRLRKAIADVGDELLAEWIASRPGTRPWFWWRYSSPERRRCISGEHYYDRLGASHVYPRGYSFGIPAFIFSRADADCTYESERDYLDRHGLLTPAEVEVIGA